MALFIDGKQARGSLVVEGDLTMPLPTYKTASGSVATFDTDMTENLISCVAEIVATQSGSGTPSPSNPRSISGFSALNGYCVGINLFNDTVGTHTITANTDQTIIIGDVWLKANQTYVISCKQTPNAVSSFVRNILLVVGNGQTVYNSAGNDYTIKPMVFTPTASGIYSIRLWGHTLPVDVDYTEFQVELGSTPTTYEPYNGTTFTVSFGQTVYGGSVDVVTGVITLTYALVDLGDLNWTSRSNSIFSSSRPNNVPLLTTPFDILCDSFDVKNVNNTDLLNYDETISSFPSYNRGIVMIRWTSHASDTPTDFKTAVTGMKLKYKLETPVIIQANSLQIPTLNGTNNLFTDTGDISCKYILSVGEALRQAV